MRGSSATTFYPLILRNQSNAANGRGVGFEFQPPDGTDNYRTGGTIRVVQATTNQDRMVFSLNELGSQVDLLDLNPNGDYVGPGSDNTISSGAAAIRWSNVFGVRFRPGDATAIWTSGTGSPEGAVTAPVGSLFTRTDGGAGTTLYVKESGAGNTGWVAK